MSAQTALVIGGSMAGLFAGNLLHRNGWDVNIYERSKTDPVGRGAGIVTHPGLLKALGEIGIPVNQGLGTPITQRLAIGRRGEHLARFEFDQILTSWSRMLKFLKEAFPAKRYHLDSEITGIFPGSISEKAFVTFANGKTSEADLIVAADGLRSSSREYLNISFYQKYAGYIAWRGVCRGEDLSKYSRELMKNNFLFSQAPGEQILSYPILDNEGPEEIKINFVWYRKFDENCLSSLLTDVNGVTHPEGIPPALIQKDHIETVRSAANSLFHTCWIELIAKCPQIILQPIYDIEVESMCMGRVALIGDAAFVARPHVGQGVTKAAGDALALRDALAKHETHQIPLALSSFSEKRVLAGRLAVRKSRQLGASVRVSPLLEDASYWANYYSNEENLIRDTAVEIPGICEDF